jgi:alpha-1,3-glucan synthase
MSVQDRLRDWNHDVNERLQVYPCLAITALDFDGIRIDKSVQVTLDGLARWSKGTRECAVRHNKTNFLISGEVVNGNTFGALY